jgi:hypothetical protein
MVPLKAILLTTAILVKCRVIQHRVILLQGMELLKDIHQIKVQVSLITHRINKSII